MSRSEVSTQTSASVEDVWAVLSDGWTYASWVVGTSRIRAVDATWPGVGSRVHHSFGPWPLIISDETVVEQCRPLESLVLKPHGGPLGAARVHIETAPAPSGAMVTLAEDAVEGPGRWLVPGPVRHRLIDVRNTETLRRLSLLAERRRHPRDDDADLREGSR